MDERDIFERHAAQVLQYFVNKVRAPADANDLAQETFVRCFQRLRRGDVEHPRAFLFGVANFVLREYWTAKARQERQAPASPSAGEFDPGGLSVAEMGAPKTSISSIMARQQGRARMLEAMRRLRLDYQNVLELRYWHDLKYSEIAEVLGQSERTIGVWIRRAKHDLRRLLAQAEASPTGAPAQPFAPRALDGWLRELGDDSRSSGGLDREPSAA